MKHLKVALLAMVLLLQACAVGPLYRDNNLSELSSTTTALTNLGFTSTIAELNTVDFTSAGQAQMDLKAPLDSPTITGTAALPIVTTSGPITGDGGDAISGYLAKVVASTSASIVLGQCGSTFVSDSTDIQVLPEASTVIGCILTFICGTADDYDINPADGTDVIGGIEFATGSALGTVLAPSAGDAIRCTDIGSSVTLQALSANLWVQLGVARGTWTDVN